MPVMFPLGGAKLFTKPVPRKSFDKVTIGMASGINLLSDTRSFEPPRTTFGLSATIS